MGQDPEAIREQIEQTRERMGDTVDALGYKADVKTRAKENIGGKIESVKDKVTGKTSQVSDAAPSGEDVKQTARQAVGVAQENPLGLAIGSVAMGFLAGMLIPSTRVEHERLGPMADQVKEQAKQTGQEALDRGKQVAQETAQTAAHVAQETAQTAAQGVRQAAEEAKQTAQETAQQHAEELKSSAQDSAQTIKESAGSQS
jgi:gas vesicle protein